VPPCPSKCRTATPSPARLPARVSACVRERGSTFALARSPSSVPVSLIVSQSLSSSRSPRRLLRSSSASAGHVHRRAPRSGARRGAAVGG
jgi:hypothetical protein